MKVFLSRIPLIRQSLPIGLAFLVFGFCVGNTVAPSFAAQYASTPKASPSVQRLHIAQQASPAALSTGPIFNQIFRVAADDASTTASTPSSPQEARGNQMLDRILKQNQLPESMVTSFKLIQSQEWNAATDGQHIIFSSALWNGLQSDDQRAFVLSHELAHIKLNHVRNGTIRNVGWSLLDRVLGRSIGSNVDSGVLSQFLMKAKSAGIALTELKFSRGAELDADETGIILMRNASYDPKAALQAFRLLEQQSGSNGGPEFLRSHPLSESRIQALSKKYQL